MPQPESGHTTPTGDWTRWRDTAMSVRKEVKQDRALNFDAQNDCTPSCNATVLFWSLWFDVMIYGSEQHKPQNVQAVSEFKRYAVEKDEYTEGEEGEANPGSKK